jgi:glycosyltransferase involved in cell wall biosynthesis
LVSGSIRLRDIAAKRLGSAARRRTEFIPFLFVLRGQRIRRSNGMNSVLRQVLPDPAKLVSLLAPLQPIAKEAGMDARVDEALHVTQSGPRLAVGASGRSAGAIDHERSSVFPQALAGLRVALVHDWLTGMRGGEKCLDVLCRSFPRAELYTLIHRRDALSPSIESMAIRTSPLQHVPRVFRYYRQLLPVMPLAARAWRLKKNVDLVISLSHCVAKSVIPPAGVPHVCYCFTPMRYAWHARETYLENWSNRPIKRKVARWMLERLREWDRATASRVTHFVAISETVRQRVADCYGRESHVIQPPVEVDFYTPDPHDRPRDDAYLVVSALVPYKRIDQAVAACTRSNRRLTVIGAGPERARLEQSAGPTVRFLGWQPDEVIRDHLRRCRALLFPGEEDFGIVPVEALACGAPVIALGRGGAAETIDDTVGRIYTEPSAAGLLGAISEWENQGCPHDPVGARVRAEQFARPLFRERLLDFLVEVVGSRSKHAMPPAPHVKWSGS